ncbi:hypothetical protein [Celeribacter neptunius]|uniref:Uncharacterized protein n=1 Tax=Celeribacter neptunius TaxID=588602 RepID=A0A1I3LC98_9RHOB|nr:hypothetical protein [Celeribacter neptunius]SFI82331.1 hypothetical protein SAMN04487991_0970 [Celeribacter neptunius]
MQQRQDFLDRLNRVSYAPQNGMQIIGPAETRAAGRNRRLAEMLARQSRSYRNSLNQSRLKLTEILSFVIAFGMGGMAALIARALRFQITGNVAQMTGDFDLALDVIFAVAVAFLLREAVSLSAVKRMGTQFAGILLAIVTMHNVVYEMPDLFSKLFSPEWVQHVRATTEPGTLYFRGESYHI